MSYFLSVDRLCLSLSLCHYCECLGHVTALLNRFDIQHWVIDNHVWHALFTLKTYVASFIWSLISVKKNNNKTETDWTQNLTILKWSM